MKSALLFCIGAALAQDNAEIFASNRSLLTERRLAVERRLAAAKCEAKHWPAVYGKKSPTEGTVDACPAATGALQITGVATDDIDDDGQNADHTRAECCRAASLCTTSYSNAGETVAGKTACTAGKVDTARKCYTTNKAGDKCGVALSPNIDAAYCCRQQCAHSTKGFELTALSADMPECPTTGGAYRVHPTASCEGPTCVTADAGTCCQKKCTSGFKLHGATATGFLNCAVGDDVVSTSAYCAGSSCTAADAATCCLTSCADGFELNAGSTDGKKKCPVDTVVTTRKGADAQCPAQTCQDAHSGTCCDTKCTQSGAGWELFQGKTAGMSQCAKDLRVHPTGYCKGTVCSSSGSICCQQKCSAGFKVKGATGTGSECGEGLTVHTEAYCEGATCAASDAGTCCQQKCSKAFKLSGVTDDKKLQTCPDQALVSTEGKCKGSPCAESDVSVCCNLPCNHKKKGFKNKGASSEQTLECPTNTMVAARNHCTKGECKDSDDDKKSCCMNTNSSSTIDAHSAGPMGVIIVGVLILLSAS